MQRRTFLGAAVFLAGCAAETQSSAAEEALPVASFPRVLDRGCGEGRARIYDECGSQVAIFRQALDEARMSNKTVIVNFGAEWCIWCHVFDAHLRGQTGRFRYPVDGQDVTLVERSGREVLPAARDLNRYAAANFVVAHIESDHAPDGWDVMESSGAMAHFNDAYPFIFTARLDGAFAAAFDTEHVEVRREGPDWYRGYNRAALLAELRRMRAAASR